MADDELDYESDEELPEEEVTQDPPAQKSREAQELARVRAERDAVKKEIAALKRQDEERKRKELTELEQYKEALKERDALLLAKNQELRRSQVQRAVRDYLAKERPDYLSAARYIELTIQLDEEAIDGDLYSDDAVSEAVQKAVKEFVKDNPRAVVERKAEAGTPAKGAGGEPSRSAHQKSKVSERAQKLQSNWGDLLDQTAKL